jgi:hypothetical protein
VNPIGAPEEDHRLQRVDLEDKDHWRQCGGRTPVAKSTRGDGPVVASRQRVEEDGDLWMKCHRKQPKHPRQRSRHEEEDEETIHAAVQDEEQGRCKCNARIGCLGEERKT